jgi:hypothetical protein
LGNLNNRLDLSQASILWGTSLSVSIGSIHAILGRLNFFCSAGDLKSDCQFTAAGFSRPVGNRLNQASGLFFASAPATLFSKTRERLTMA